MNGRWITIRSQDSGVFPASGTRLRPSNAGALAKLVSGDLTQSVVNTDAGAHNYRLILVEITVPVGAPTANTLVSLGTGAEATRAALPYNLILDRVIFTGRQPRTFGGALR